MWSDLGHDPGPQTPAQRLTRLFAEHAPVVLAYALRRGLTKEEAEDVVGKTFLVAARKVDQVPEDARSWLLAVARRVLADFFRSRRREEALWERLENETRAGETALTLSDEDEAWRALSARLRDRAVREALASLSENEREALMLVVWDGLGVAEGARVMGCSYAAFALRLFRARRKVAKILYASGHMEE